MTRRFTRRYVFRGATRYRRDPFASPCFGWEALLAISILSLGGARCETRVFAERASCRAIAPDDRTLPRSSPPFPRSLRNHELSLSRYAAGNVCPRCAQGSVSIFRSRSMEENDALSDYVSAVRYSNRILNSVANSSIRVFPMDSPASVSDGNLVITSR